MTNLKDAALTMVLSILVKMVNIIFLNNALVPLNGHL